MNFIVLGKCQLSSASIHVLEVRHQHQVACLRDGFHCISLQSYAGIRDEHGSGKDSVLASPPLGDDLPT